MAEHDERREVNRRTFLFELAAMGSSAAGLPALARVSAGALSFGAAPSSARQIGLQLYTVRDLLEKDFEGTLERVARIGYKKVEFAGYFNRTPEQVRAILDRLQLTSPSAHVGAQQMRQDAAAQIRSAKVIGQEYITIPSYPFPRGGGIDGWKQGAAELGQWGEKCRQAGLRLAYHNHAAEFATIDGGPTGYDVLLREVPANLVDFELDLYWATFAGQDPIALFAKHPGRFAMWHVKDLKLAGGTKTMAPVGRGTLDFKTIFAHAREAGMKHFFVEQDDAATTGGSLASIQASYTYLRRLLA
jgi:sugar phosphate isomerase/epimerase